MKTEQSIFDTVVTHLRKQSHRSVTTINGKNGRVTVCRYRGRNKTKCAVGCLIPNSQYHYSLEGKSVIDLISNKLLAEPLLSEFKTHKNLLMDLQEVHDDYVPVEWEKQFKVVAVKYDLTTPSLVTEKK